jgi:hypothetical protein
VSHSDFSFIGGNGVVAWGYTNETATDPGRPGVQLVGYPEAGVDGTDGEHPTYTTVTSNSIREVGLYEKQSSFFIQAKTAFSQIHGNVFFNGPRAGINANDGFGGGDDIGHNLVFSSCRESGDHGPFNSWDRQPFLTTCVALRALRTLSSAPRGAVRSRPVSPFPSASPRNASARSATRTGTRRR